jgi:hypothetical protein
MNAIELNNLIVREPGIFFVPFSRSHTAEMQINQPELRAEATADLADIFYAQSKTGLACTVIWNTKPVAIFGSVSMWPGVNEAWAAIDEEAHKRPKQMVKIGRQFMDIVEKHYNLHRHQIYVRVDSEKAIRYAEALKFRKEGLMVRYTSDKCDSLLMARV